ncbi:MAG: Undecaprenyl-phosphate galactose phosphotransferase [Candidatus Amesbacteria bacterium GW2011_GWA1_47_16]|uniref:Undecaprenyl-phosphate galactose phosphotransferase n=3 Tax=Candidatus Amesiibacteriota TaxID=1752730 RepID=A0A0G1UFP6_9BACT|nr:MAG: undecaprenyl-phosphate galactose phosphotransferase [Candidatus Amesbacteria bacterium GW2011_GWC1_47_15]KKU65118.1 MAG: Undecaprenyl-phosphate galactose phosphotransferase [Candidatus Amesbacteria bacterium GW2011_GWA1_47_16]KKU97746.1 MAG: Undecaprenyl-phosphate galactose phosphotransferase [Candidatus Amesbacteria bacterium GW2011_GWB1_48_13]
MLYPLIKRIMDIICSVILLFVFWPVALIVAAAIKLETPKGPIFVELSDRVGKNGRVFRLLKFRSMIPNARYLQFHDPRYKEYLKNFKKNSYKVENDPLRTSVGRVIVKYSLDETPQFINVLKGDMSLVGPRPYYPDELAEQKKRFPNTDGSIQKALSVRPGITGQWQVSGRSDLNFDKRIELDANYAANMSLWYDLKILLKTPYVMLSGKGSGVK